MRSSKMRSTRFRVLLALAVVGVCAPLRAEGEIVDDEEGPPRPEAAAEPSAPAAPALSPEEEAAIAAALAAAAGSEAPTTTAEPPAAPMAAVTSALAGVKLDLAVVLDVALAVFSDEERALQEGGHDPNRTGFTLQQLEMSIGSSVDPYFRFDANIVFAEAGVEIEEAYATTTSLPFALQARAGQFLTRFGRINPTHPHSWDFVDQALVIGKMMGSEGNRGLGLELSWLVPLLPWYVEVLGSVTNARGECCARSTAYMDVLPVVYPWEQLFTGALKQFFPMGDDLSLFVGASGQSGPNPTGKGNRSELAGVDLYLRYRPVTSSWRTTVSLTSEAVVRRRQVPDDVLMDAGGYAQITGSVLDQWELGARIETVTGVDDDPLHEDWRGLRSRAAIAGTFYPSHFARVRAQLSYGADDEDPTIDAGSVVSRPVVAAFLALEVLVGAHGAHQF